MRLSAAITTAALIVLAFGTARVYLTKGPDGLGAVGWLVIIAIPLTAVLLAAALVAAWCGN